MSRRAALAAALAALTVGLPAAHARADTAQDARAIDQVEKEIADARQRLNLVREYVQKVDSRALDRANQRFSEAETQFLLENYEGCTGLLLSVVDVPEFQASPHYPRALYYLGESLYQAQSYLDALRYFRLAVPRLKVDELYRDSIVRLIDLADRTGDSAGVDQYFQVAQAAGQARPEVTYLYAKWIAHRKDLPEDARLSRADDEFSRVPPDSAFYPPALYFRGAIRILQARDDEAAVAGLAAPDKPPQDPARAAALNAEVAGLLDQAAGFERQILALKKPGKMNRKFIEARNLADLALARILFEEGSRQSDPKKSKALLEEATDRYNQVPRDSADYNDALFETAATFVKMGNYPEALQTADILLIIGKDSPVASEAETLQGNLQLRLGQYDRASRTFQDVVSTYSPVYEQIKALLTRPDPVAYFDALLTRSGAGLDVLNLLPAAARPFVKFDRQVKDAHVIASELAQDKQGIQESQKYAARILDALGTKQLDRFPELRDGNSRAIEESNELASLESRLIVLEEKLLGDGLSPEVRQGLNGLDDERKKLDQRFGQLPKSQEQYEERKTRFFKRIHDLDSLAFSLSNKIQELRATVVALRIFWDQSDERSRHPALDKERQTDFDEFDRLVKQLEDERQGIVRQIATERETAAAQANGGQLEETLRGQYKDQLTTMQGLIDRALPAVPPENRPLIARIQSARGDIDSLQTELAGLRGKMLDKAQAESEVYRKEVLADEKLLDGYQRQVDGVDGKSRHLLGAIAFDAFSRVGQQFHDIVLKGDVGVIDVAWARKQDKTDRISELGRDKDEAIKRLQARFTEVLNDAQ